MTVMAQFPLQSVLLPGMPLGLQIFEPRYLQLLDDVVAGDGRFGVVMITRGSEVGGSDERAEIGTVAEVVARQPMPGDRWLLEALGVERFRVVRWLDDAPYPRAEVEPWTPLLDPLATEAFVAASEQFQVLLSIVSELGVDVDGLDVGTDETDTDRLHVLYRMAAVAPIATHDRYRILAAETDRAAAAILVDALEGATEVLRFRLQGG